MKDFTKFWFLNDFNLFKKIGKNSLMQMSHLLDMINIKKGETLFLTREDKEVVYFLKSGTIKIVNSEKDYVRSILNAGNLFGELTLYNDGYNDVKEEKAIVLEDGVVCVIETKEMKMMLEKYGSLKNQLLKINGIRIRKLQRNLEDLLYKDSRTRIKEYILSYINQFGIEKDGMVKAKNLLSHKDIAQLTSTSRQTVSNVMSELRKEGVVDYNTTELKVSLKSNSV